MCDAGPLSSIAWANFLASGWFVQLAHSCYLSKSAQGVDNHLFMPFLTHWGQVTLKCISNLCPLLLSFLLLFFLLAHCYFLSCYSIHTATPKNCYFLSCYFFSYLPTVTFFLLLFFLLVNCYFLSCYFFSCYFFSYLKLLLSFLLPFFLLLSFRAPYSTAPQPVHTSRRPGSDCGLACWWTMNPGSGQSYCSFNSHTNSIQFNSISLLYQRPPTCKAGLFWQVQDLTRFTHLTRNTHTYIYIYIHNQEHTY